MEFSFFEHFDHSPELLEKGLLLNIGLQGYQRFFDNGPPQGFLIIRLKIRIT